MSEFNFNPHATGLDLKNAYCLGEAAKLAYEKSSDIIQAKTKEWGMSYCQYFENKKTDTQAFLAANDQMILCSFRGTESLKSGITDLDFFRVDGFGGMVHRGFKRAFDSIWSDIKEAIVKNQTGSKSLWFTGHSLGAALATLAVSALQEEGKSVNGLYTFGSPRVGNRSFAKTFNASCGAYTFRFVNNNDVVPRLPLAIRYLHVETIQYMDKNGILKHDISCWEKLFDRFKGRIEDLGKPGTDGMKDHFIDHYMESLKKNLV